MSLAAKLKIMRVVKNPAVLGSNKNTLSRDLVEYLLKAVETADKALYADIENDLVEMGKDAVAPLVKALQSSNPKVRGCAAMALIRIGNDAVDPLLSEYLSKPKYHWMLEYILSEVRGPESLPTFPTQKSQVVSLVAG